MIVAKVGDVAPGMCVCVPVPPGPFPATGVVTTGSPLFLTSGMPIAVAGLSIVMYPCGTSMVVPSSVSLLIAGVSAAEMGNTVIGCGMGTLIGTSTIMSL